MHYLRLLLLPFSLLYALVIWVRNYSYDRGWFASRAFDVPVIAIGNLAVGGAGKSPMAEYIIKLLRAKHKVAILSRGYGRTTRGFRLVLPGDKVAESGDEPLQFRNKFDDITVAVAEKRVEGLERLEHDHDVVILDDAYQHRAVKPGLTILVFDYTRLNDFFLVLPAGNLREPFSNRDRAQILVVSKCPNPLSEIEKEQVKKIIKPLNHQEVFFSYLDYGKLKLLSSSEEKELSDVKGDTAILLLTGIANPKPLVNKLREFTATIIHQDYPDHHLFTPKNIAKLVGEFHSLSAIDKIIITTEKDAQRLKEPALLELLNGLPVYYLPVSARIHEPDEIRFNTLIESYVTEHT